MAYILSLNRLSFGQVQWIQHFNQMKTSLYTECLLPAQPEKKVLSNDQNNFRFCLDSVGLAVRNNRQIHPLPVFQDRNIPCTIVVLIRVLYKHTAVCHNQTESSLSDLRRAPACSSETKLTVNFRNRIIWCSSQI